MKKQTPPANAQASIITQANDRMSRYKALLVEFNIDTRPEAVTNTGEEDAIEWVTGQRPMERFCVVTSSNSDGALIHYAYAEDTTLRAAKLHALENIDDTLFAETPVCIVDLDTGHRFEPHWDNLPWLSTQEGGAQ